MTNLPARLRNEAQLVHGQRRDLLIEAAEALDGVPNMKTTTLAAFNAADGALEHVGDMDAELIKKYVENGKIVVLVPVAGIKEIELFECLSILEINDMRRNAYELLGEAQS